MSKKIFLTVTVAAIVVIAFSVGALFNAVEAPAMGGVSLAFCAMIFMYTMHQETTRKLSQLERTEILRELERAMRLGLFQDPNDKGNTKEWKQ